MSNDKNYTIKDKKEEKSQLTITIEVEKDFMNQFRDQAIKSAGKDLEVKGFRKGTAPDDVVVEKVGEMAILQEQAYVALNQIIPIVVAEEKINAITNPDIEITKISPDENLEFKATFTLMPEIKLPDYKALAKEVDPEEEVEVTDKEIEDYIEYLRKQKAESDFVQKKTNGEEVDEKEKENLPEFNDEFVKTLGEFENVDDFKKQLKENMTKDKETKSKQNRRIKIIEGIIEKAEVEIPDVLIEEETERMLQNFKSQIENMKIDFDEYLKQVGKSVDELKKEWHSDAIKRVKTDLILPKIAKEEGLKPDQEKIEKELEHIKEHHKDINEEHAKIYITHGLTNEKVFEFLENLK